MVSLAKKKKKKVQELLPVNIWLSRQPFPDWKKVIWESGLVARKGP